MQKLFTAVFVLFFAVFAYGAEKKNIIFVVADGGGPAVMGFLMQYARYAENSPYKDRISVLEKMFDEGKNGILLNATQNTLVSDSAAAGTHLAKGVLTYPEHLGISWQGEDADSLLKKAKRLGMATGLITDVYLSDATPSAFAASAESRRDYETITPSLLTCGADVLLGGGLDYFVSQEDLSNPNYSAIFNKIPFSKDIKPKSKQNIFEKLLTSGYGLSFDKKSLQNARTPKLIGLFGAGWMPLNISPKSYAPDLLDMTKKAVEILSKNDKGFFLLVEAGMLDWMLHDNDQGAVLAELLELDKTLGYIKDFADKNSDTLVIITADHDTGGFGFTYRDISEDEILLKQQQNYPVYDKKDYVLKSNLDIIAKQTKMQRDMRAEFSALPQDKQTPEAIQKYLKENMGYELDLQTIKEMGSFDKSLNKVNELLGITWSTATHTASSVFINFYGAKAADFPYVMHNTQANKLIEEFLYDGK